MVRLFGDWKKPKPSPQTAIKPAIANVVCEGMRPSETSPRARTPSPAPLRIGAEYLSANRPAKDAAIPAANGQGVIRSPVSTWLRCSTPWK